jgi:hypothetical protein
MLLITPFGIGVRKDEVTEIICGALTNPLRIRMIAKFPEALYAMIYLMRKGL